MIGDMTRRGSSPVFVGRRAELAQLERAFERARQGEPSLVLVAGEAGVGKSRLVAEFVERAEVEGGLASFGGCLDLVEGGLPYGPFAEALRSLARAADADGGGTEGSSSSLLAGVVAALRPHLGRSGPTPALDPVERLAGLFDSILDLLGRLAAERPLVLVLEDLQWADGSTRDLIRFIVRNLRAEPLLVVATIRTDDLHRRHPLMPLLAELERAGNVERLDVPPLDRAELGEQLTAILGEAPTDGLLNAMLARSDGLPFFVEELVAARRLDAGLPESLRDILGQRLASLSPQATSIVRVAAVAGGPCSHQRLAATSGMAENDLIDAVHEAVDSGILVTNDLDQEPTYRFRHALMREAAYDELLPAERVRLHARLADELAGSIGAVAPADLAVLADLATHAYRSHDQRRALETAVLTVRAYMAAAAYRDGLAHAERAIELWSRVDDAADLVGMDHPDLLQLTGQIASAANRPDVASSLTQAALTELGPGGDEERRLSLLAALYLYAWEAQDFGTAATAIEEAYGLAEGASTSRSAALVLHWLGWHRSWEGRSTDGIRLLEAAMTMHDSLGDRAAWTDSAACAAGVLAEAGAVAKAGALIDRSIAGVADDDGRLGRMHADLDRSLVLCSAGRFAEALHVAERGLARATRYGWDARLGPGLRACMADACLELGRYEQLERAIAPVIAGDGIHHHVIWSRQVLVRALVARGLLEEAHRHIDAVVPDRSRWSTGAWDILAMVELARAEGRFDDVVAWVDASAAGAADREVITPLPYLLAAGIGACADAGELARRRHRAADVAAARDHAARWSSLLASLVERVRPSGGAGPFTEAHRATAEAESTRLLGSSDPSAWRGCIDRWAALDHPYGTAYARLRFAEAILGSVGDRALAEREVVEAHAGASRIGAELLRLQLEALAASAQIRLPGSVQASPTPSSAVLTPRERGVMELVVQGHTNREIGGRLFISEKTVSVHVSNVMAKLGALSRYEAAAAAVQRGLL